MDGILFILKYVLPFMGLLCVGGVIADHVLPRIKPLEKWFESLPKLGLDYPKVDFDELFLLSKIITAEAGSYWLPWEWKLSVGEVVLNRVASPEFPDTVEEVIYQENPLQYYSRNDRYFRNLLPYETSVKAAWDLLNGERVLCDPSVVFQANYTQGSGIAVHYYDRLLGSTYFCYSSRPWLYEG